MSINIRTVSFLNGGILCGLAAAMSIPLLYDCICGSYKNIEIFVFPIIGCLFIGVSTLLSCKTDNTRDLSLSSKDTFLLVFSIWISSSICSSIPFYLYNDQPLDFVSSFFESVSGLSATGATMYQNVEALPKSIVLWRFILHFIGGVGIIALGMTALPAMRIGGMQLFLTEHQVDKIQKYLPRTSQIVGYFFWIYITIISLFAILLRFGDMNWFDAICHSITAISTGGFSSKNNGLDFYHSDYINTVMAVAMIIGGVTFLEVIKCISSGFKSFYKNQQVMGYFKVISISLVMYIFITIFDSKTDMSLKTISNCFFNVSSAISSTRISISGDNGHALTGALILILSLIGGCSGSTAAGIKIFRAQVLYTIVKQYFKQLSKPLEISIPKYNGQKIDTNLITSVISFLILLAVTFAASVTLVAANSSCDFLSSMSLVTSSLFNLGYDYNFAEILPLAKFVLSVDMIAGRLEIIPIFIIFRMAFWTE